MRLSGSSWPHELPGFGAGKLLCEAKPELSVTEVGLAVRFSGTSPFTPAFQKATGLTPSAYHRSLR